MNLNFSTQNYNQNFQARIKMKKPTPEQILGVSAVGSGLSAVASAPNCCPESLQDSVYDYTNTSKSFFHGQDDNVSFSHSALSTLSALSAFILNNTDLKHNDKKMPS